MLRPKADRNRKREERMKRSWIAGLWVVLLAGCGSQGPDPIALAEDTRVAGSAELLGALTEGSSDQAIRAVVAMGRIQHASYADALVQTALSEDPRLRRTALFALGQFGLAGVDAPGAVDACVAALEDSDPEIVAAAVEALGKLATGSQTESAVLPLLDHPSSAVRAEAAMALFRHRFVPLWRGEAEEPPVLSGPAVDGLVAAMADSSEDVRRAAVYAFSRYGEVQAVPALTSRLSDADEWTRLFAARALGRSGEAGAVEALAALLADPSERVRAEAVSAISALDGTERIPAGLLDDPSPHVRVALARAWAGSESEATLMLVRRLEADESPSVRAAAVGTLASRLAAGYAEALAARLEDPSWTVRAAAAAALGGLASVPPEWIDLALQDPDQRVVVAALGGLGGSGDHESRILAALAADDLAVRGTAVGLISEANSPQRLDWLTGAYDDSAGLAWIEVREAIVGSLPADASAEGFLTRVVESDPAPSVRAAAAEALVDLGVQVPAADPAPIEPSPFLDQSFSENPVVVLETDHGPIEIRCLADEAPIHVASFVKRVEDGFYDGLIWHRVVSNFVIQGGDPRGDGWGGAGYTLRDEINPVRYGRGAVGMPKAGKDTGGGQIFITHTPTPHLDGNYTVFGQVISGMEAVDAIEVGDRIVSARLR